MTIADFVSLGILIVLLGAHLLVRPLLVRRIRSASGAAFSLLALALFLQTRMQFLTWQNSPPPAQYLVPPFAPMSYLLQYAWLTIWIPYLLSCAGGLFLLLLINRIPAGRKNLIFETDESWLIVLSICLLGHPGWIIYLGVSLLLYLGLSVTAAVRTKENKRVSLYRLWLPLAVAVKISAPYLLASLPWLARLRLS